MIVIAERIFTSADQSSFAAVSGDFNPVHMDEVAARRTFFGAPVVHGVHLLCWALDSLAGIRRQAFAGMQRVTASFDRSVLVGDVVRACLLNDGEEFNLQIQRNQSHVASIRGKLGPTVVYNETFPPMDSTECRMMDAFDIDSAEGSLPLAYSSADVSRLFPQLSATLPPLQFAALLATTRLVGMECPGLHSLFSGLDLSFSASPNGKPQLNYRVARPSRFGAISLLVVGPGFQGELRAFLRPKPCAQATVREIAQRVKEDAFFDQRAIVIGGSRGLGEVTAKLLAMGGANVMITYQRGKADAEAVAAEINAAGGECAVLQFDCNHPSLITLPHSLTHLYYYATPHIGSDTTLPFSADRFAQYCRYYVTGFADALLVIAQGARTMNVFYPSTVFLDDAPDHMAEYCAAKAAGEEICKQLAKHFRAWRFYAPRLPRMHTDQNNGLVPEEMEPAEIVMLRHLQEMNAKSSALASSSRV